MDIGLPLNELKVGKVFKDPCSICICNEGKQITLECGHNFHHECLVSQITAEWSGVVVSFSYLCCAICRSQLAHPSIDSHLESHLEVRDFIMSRAVLEILKDEYVVECDFPQDPDEIRHFAFSKLAYFKCGSCDDIFCGGLLSCGYLNDISDPSSIQCSKCEENVIVESEYSDYRCKKHTDCHNDALYKCDSCCRISSWRCVNDRYCAEHHDRAYDPDKTEECPGPEKCPLKIAHPPNFGSVHGITPRPHKAFIIGCAKCIEEEALTLRNSFPVTTQEQEAGQVPNMIDREPIAVQGTQ